MSIIARGKIKQGAQQMAYPLIENISGSLIFLNGEFYDADSPEALALKEPYASLSYYETLRLIGNTPLFIEEHMARLDKSVASDPDADISLAGLVDDIRTFLKAVPDPKQSSLRIVVADKIRLIHYVDIALPTEEDFRYGVRTASLCWEREDPNIKAFRGDYKSAVAKVFEDTGAFEVILADNDGNLYEGSKSNFFAVIDGAVYSAPDNKILIGITRKRVMEALRSLDLKLQTGMFTLNELKEHGAAMFVSSTPFDILPIASVDGIDFDSAENAVVKEIMNAYKASQMRYIDENNFLEA